MRVCLDISAALGQGAGIGRYTRELALALHALPGGPELVLFHNRQPGRIPRRLGDLPRFKVPCGDRTWRILALSGLRVPGMRRAGYHFDLFHGPDTLAPSLPQRKIITIHDLSPLVYPQHHTLLHRSYVRWSLPRLVKRASAVIAVSNATKHDLVERLGLAPGKIHVVPNGVDHKHFHPLNKEEAGAVAESLGVTPPYILSLGTLEPRKNLSALFEAYARLGLGAPQMVLAGAKGWGRDSVFDLARRLDIAGRVRFTGHVPDRALPALYAGAELFVYPSLYEGFGLPVLEALACGVPTIAGRTSSLPEVAGDAALLVDPPDAERLAQAIKGLLENPELRSDLRVRSLRRAARFSWERTAGETMAVYQSVLSNVDPDRG